MQWSVKKFGKGDESCEDGGRSGQPSEVDTNQPRAIIKADPPTTTREVDEELHDHATVIRHLKQIGKVKKLNKWVPHVLIQIKKIVEVSFFLIAYNNEPFLNQFAQ